MLIEVIGTCPRMPKARFGPHEPLGVKDFFVNFFCNKSSKKNSIQLPNDPNCSIHEFYKGRLQSLTEKKFDSG